MYKTQVTQGQFWPHKAKIDGNPNCVGCFEATERVVVNPLDGSKRISRTCTWTMPRCQCPECRIYCDSDFEYSGKKYKVDTEGIADDPVECSKWYLEEDCVNC